MSSPAPFQTEMIRLRDGTRLIRVTDLATGTALERRLDPEIPVLRQKAAVLAALHAVLDRELKDVAAA